MHVASSWSLKTFGGTSWTVSSGPAVVATWIVFLAVGVSFTTLNSDLPRERGFSALSPASHARSASFSVARGTTLLVPSEKSTTAYPPSIRALTASWNGAEAANVGPATRSRDSSIRAFAAREGGPPGRGPDGGPADVEARLFKGKNNPLGSRIQRPVRRPFAPAHPAAPSRLRPDP